MSEKPILMSAASVRAILGGVKTQTRRVIRGGPYRDDITPEFLQGGMRHLAPYRLGDLLYMKEPWRLGTATNLPQGVAMLGEYPTEVVSQCPIGLDVDFHVPHPSAPPKAAHMTLIWRKRSPLFMPRWAARPERLRVTGLRVQRVQDIDEADAIAEGVSGCDPVGAFAATWDALNAKRGFPWAANPWVWVIEFEVAR